MKQDRSLFQSTRNTRALPTGTMRYIRSDVPLDLTEQEILWLRENHITTIVDLRSDEEAAQKPCCLEERDGFRYYHLPVTGGGDTPRSPEHLYTVYRQMADEQMEKILTTIMSAESNVLYFVRQEKVDIEIIIPHKENMERFLKQLSDRTPI